MGCYLIIAQISPDRYAFRQFLFGLGNSLMHHKSSKKRLNSSRSALHFPY